MRNEVTNLHGTQFPPANQVIATFMCLPPHSPALQLFQCWSASQPGHSLLNQCPTQGEMLSYRLETETNTWGYGSRSCKSKQGKELHVYISRTRLSLSSLDHPFYDLTPLKAQALLQKDNNLIQTVCSSIRRLAGMRRRTRALLSSPCSLGVLSGFTAPASY